MGWKHFGRGVECPICGAVNNNWCSHTDDVLEGEPGYKVRCMVSDLAPPGWVKISSKATQGGATYAVQGVPLPGDNGRKTQKARKKQIETKSAARAAENRKRARDLYAAARPLGESERATDYLLSRGLSLPDGEHFAALRFDPSCPYRPIDFAADLYDRRAASRGAKPWPRDDRGVPAEKAYSALIAAVTGPDDASVTAVQRIYLHPGSGARGKLPMSDAKKTLGQLSRGAVKLGRVGTTGADVRGEVLVVCEGIETGLALWLATGLTVWACVSTAGMRGVALPEGQRPAKIIIAADNDAWAPKPRSYPGLHAALGAAARLGESCQDIRVALPPVPPGVVLGRGRGERKSVDWLDVWCDNRVSADEMAEMVLRGCMLPSACPDPRRPPEGVDLGTPPAAPRGTADDDRGVWGGDYVWVKKHDPMDQAEQFLRTPYPPDRSQTYFGAGGLPHLRRWAEGFWRYDGTRWKRVKDEKMRSLVKRFLRQTVVAKKQNDDGEWEYDRYGTSMTRAASVVQHLEPVVMLGGIGDEPDKMPVWLTSDGLIDEDGPDPADCIAFANGILDVRAWERGEKVMRPHSPGWFSAACLPYELPDEAHPARPDLAWERAPVYRSFIGRLFDEDTSREPEDMQGLEQVDLWHEWAGYCMVPDCSVHAICGIQGFPGTGKGTLIRLFTQLFGGDDQVASTSLVDMGEKYGLEPLLGKLVIIDPDAESDWSAQAKEGAARLKKISGDDAVQVRRMGQPSIPSVRLVGRMTLVCNDIIRLPDAGGAFKRRLFWLITPSPLPPSEVDYHLDEKLSAELPWVAVHALDGLTRLRRRLASRGPGFVTPAKAQLAQEQFEEASSPVSGFVRDALRPSLGGGGIDPGQLTKDEVYAAYEQWSEEEGRKPLGKPNFGRQLLMAAPWISAHRETSGKRVYVYRGLALNVEYQPEIGVSTGEQIAPV